MRRARRLVVSFHVTVANYEYLVYWRFYQDGNIECEVRATGIMVATHFAEGEQPPYGTLVDQRTYAPFHQHFLVARLDMDVDGDENTVFAIDSEALPIGRQPRTGSPSCSATPRCAPRRRASRTTTGHPAGLEGHQPELDQRHGHAGGYKLVPGGAFPPMMDPSSPVFNRAQVIGHTLWVTPFNEEERWPCGEFANQSARDEGLPVWTAQNRSIENTDVVLWYVFGIHHITRVGGLAGHAGGQGLVLAQAVRLLRPQPVARRRRRAPARLPRRSRRTADERRRARNFVDGESVDAAEGGTTDVVNPSTGEVYATSPLSGQADVDAAMQARRTAFDKWRDTTPSERSPALLRDRRRDRGRAPTSSSPPSTRTPASRSG